MSGTPKEDFVWLDHSQWSEGDQALLRGIRSIDRRLAQLPDRLPKNDTTQQFIVWAPNIPTGESITIASSRLNQKLDEQNEWFDALRTLAVRLSEENKFLLTAGGTTADQFVRRISELFLIPIVTFEPFPESPTQDWFQKKSKEQGTPLQSFAYYKQLDERLDSFNSKREQKRNNINDLLIAGSHSCVLLSVRNKGNIFRAANRRLNNENDRANEREHASTRLLINRSLTPKAVEQTLIENGATGWWLFDKTIGVKIRSENEKRSPIAQTPILSLTEIKTENYLLHWTRRRVGPWPDQSQPEFIDDLIFQTSRRNHGEVSSVCRILAARRILGSNELTRDRRSVVCFADLPLDQLPEKRVFRPHLSRWDFELFGIAIERDLMIELGAQPVSYGNEEDWEQLPKNRKPFFQLQKSKSKKIDWKTESEWRVLGDLNLELVPHDQAIVFVKTIEDAHHVSQLSHWPIVVLTGS